MARASGPAVDGWLPADFLHAASAIHYRVYQQDGKVWLSYRRDDPSRPLDGKQQLEYFIGSGKRGRTYLFEQDGYWFEAPINWYAKKQLWDMAPAYQQTRAAPLTLPVDPGCLHCHASGAASSLADARNHYTGAPFATGGITCGACHGDAQTHLASGGRTHMSDLDALPAVRRDSVCLSCHLEGQAEVNRLGKRPEEFRPGDNLFDYAVFFVHRGENGSGGRATSQFEALLKSRCKQQSGDKLTCTTCHDPHSSPAPDERVAFYRAKCLQCHSAMAERHHPENQDCTVCHMARPPSNDIAHEQVTDHWIRRRVSQDALPLVTTGDLIAVGGAPASDRDLGLAYAQMAMRGDQAAGERAEKLLESAEAQTGGATADHALHAQLGFLYQVAGHTEAAEQEYRKALIADPNDAVAAGNLALLAAGAHRYAEAMRLWSEVFARDPVELGAGFDLAVVQCGAGQRDAALATLDRILSFAPDNDRARTMASAVRAGKQACAAR
jgi:predicted CXXCH cytochrome family protein